MKAEPLSAFQAATTIIMLMIREAFYVLRWSLVTAAAMAVAVWFSLPRSKAHGEDLVQDYLSIRAWLQGQDPYQDLVAMRANNGFPPTEPDPVPSNPHPPGAILLTLPVALFPFATAFVLWKILNLFAMALAWNGAWLVWGRLTWKTALAGGIVGLWAPLWQGLDFGQPSGLLALAMLCLWLLARGSTPFVCGLALGFCCTLRPYFFVLSAIGWRWSHREIVRATGGAICGGLLPFFFVQKLPWVWWTEHASASASYANIMGTLGGVFQLGTSGGVVLILLAWILLSIASACSRKKESPGSHTTERGLRLDAGMALAMAGILWLYPLAWYHYDAFMIPALVWMGCESHRRDDRWPFLAMLLYLISRAYPSVREHYHLLMYVQFVGRTILVLGILRLALRR